MPSDATHPTCGRLGLTQPLYQETTLSVQQPAIDPAVTRGVEWLRFVAVLPPLMTAVAFASAWQQWGSDFATVMAKTIQLEFLVIHAGLFIGVCIMVPVESALFRVLRWVAVALFATMYLRVGYSLLGWNGALTIAAIFVGTYAGFLTSSYTGGTAVASRGRRAAEIGTRWGVAMLSFGLLSTAFQLPESVNAWAGLRSSVALGALYFATLAVVECTPLYGLIRGVHAPAGRMSGGH